MRAYNTIEGRRGFLRAVGGGVVVAVSPEAVAQNEPRVYRLGILSAGSAMPTDLINGASRVPELLRTLGYVEGRNLVIDRRYAEGRSDQIPRLARELAQAPVDLVLAIGTGPAQLAESATKTIPIVFLGNFDPVAAGLVRTLARPGGNVTGILITPEGSLAGKKFELLHEIVPRATRIALLVPDDSAAGVQQQIEEARQAAPLLRVEAIVVIVRGRDYAGAFATLDTKRAEALVVGAHSFFVRDQREIIERVAKQGLPAIYEWPQQVKNGGLMSYGADEDEVYEQVAAHIDRIFRGSQPSDLPIWAPEKLHIVINLKTARALGLSIPQPVLLRADKLVQ
jgi:putative ABC transport system substrate-binding protein